MSRRKGWAGTVGCNVECIHLWLSIQTEQWLDDTHSCGRSRGRFASSNARVNEHQEPARIAARQSTGEEAAILKIACVWWTGSTMPPKGSDVPRRLVTLFAVFGQRLDARNGPAGPRQGKAMGYAHLAENEEDIA
jgi:hypothetical protein